jgi:hypothetical protein
MLFLFQVSKSIGRLFLQAISPFKMAVFRGETWIFLASGEKNPG